AVDAVVDIRINEFVEPIDLGAQRRGIEIRIRPGDSFEFAVEHADDLGRLVVDDLLRLLVPERWYGNLAGIRGIRRCIGLVQILEAIDCVRRAIGKRRIVLECPTLLLEAGDRVRHANSILELLERAEDQGAVRPRAAVGNIEVIASRLRLESGRTICSDTTAKSAVGAMEFAAAAGFL